MNISKSPFHRFYIQNNIKNIMEFLNHEINTKPWGMFELFVKNKSCSIKILYLNRNQCTSLQYHNYRNEFWKILKGKVEVVYGKQKLILKEGDIFFIQKRRKHRIIAKMNSEILEISFGYYDEDDVKRLEDKYGRV